MSKNGALSPLAVIETAQPRRNDGYMCYMLFYKGTSLDKHVELPPELTPYNKRGGVPRTAPLTIWTPREKAGEYLAPLRKANGMGWDVYYSATAYPREIPAGEKRSRSKESVERAFCLYADYDEPSNPQARDAFISGKSYKDIPAPSVIVNTSEGRYQCLWRLSQPYGGSDLSTIIEPALAYICETTDGDRAVKDIARILRLPGDNFVNNKRGKYPVTASPGSGSPIGRGQLLDMAKKGIAYCHKNSAAQARQQPTAQRQTRNGAVTIIPNATERLSPGVKLRVKELWTRNKNLGQDGWTADYAIACYLAGCRKYSYELITSVLKEIHPSKAAWNLAATVRNARETVN